jgi:hypothetical protein
MSSFGKLVVLIVVLAVIGVLGHDGIEIAKAQKDVRSTAHAAASDAAYAIAHAPPGTTPAARDEAGSTAASQEAAKSGDVVETYNYDSGIANTIHVTIGASADTWIIGHIDKKIADDIKASASATPPVVQG